MGKVLDILVSGLSAETDVVSQDIETEAADIIQEHRGLLEIYCFLLQWGVMALELKAAANDKPAAAAAPARKKAQPKSAWNSEVQLQHALEAMCKVLKLKLLRLFVTTSERDTFVSLFTRPVYLVLENEQRVKTVSIRMHVFKVLCMAVKHHGHGFGESFSYISSIRHSHSGRCTNVYRTELDILRTPFGAHGRVLADSCRTIRLSATGG